MWRSCRRVEVHRRTQTGRSNPEDQAKGGGTLRTRRRITVAAMLLASSVLPLEVLGVGCAALTGEPSAGRSTSVSSPSPVRSPGSPAGSSTGSPGSASPTSLSTPEPTGSATSNAPRDPRLRTIVIDPGHSGRIIRSVDRTGLRDIDYPNYPEIYEMFDVSVCIAQSLRADGYRVLLTKRHALSSVSHRQRANVANRAKADLAISVHDDHGVGPRFEATYSQRGGKRSDGAYPVMFRGRGNHRTTFRLPAVARRSDQAAHAIAAARSETQHRAVAVTQNSFNGRDPLEPGNLALVQLFSEVPWVYNEMGALTGGSTTRAMSIASERGYAAGLLSGVEAAVPLPPGHINPRSQSAASLTGCLRQQVEPTPGDFNRPRRYLPAGF